MGKYKFRCAGCYEQVANCQLGYALENLKICDVCRSKGVYLKMAAIVIRRKE